MPVSNFDKNKKKWHNSSRNGETIIVRLLMKGSNIMTEKKIRLRDSEEVENFVNATGQCDFEIDILSDHIYIDAKSLLGVLGLGFKRVLTVKYFGENAKFEKTLQNYAVA